MNTLALRLFALGMIASLSCDPPPSQTQPAPASAALASSQPPANLLEAIPDHAPVELNAEQASKFVQLSLACVDRQYPNKPGTVLTSDASLVPPEERTPSFYGCFDWHSAVHGHWAMVRVLRRFPQIEANQAVRAKLGAHLTPARLNRELSFFRETENRTFERPYGWGWLLRLAAELHGWDDEQGRGWSKNLEPLALFLAGRMAGYLPQLTVPVREGTHANTAFAMVHALDYARTVGDTAFEKLLVDRARDFYLGDRGCPTDYEPSGEDFISPCLVEADLMRRVLSPNEFVIWLRSFLPPMEGARFRPLLRPVEVRDRKDPKIGHLIGLALQRAWCMHGIAGALPDGDPRRPALDQIARLHRHDALQQMFDSGYGGEHWLASFAIYLLTDVGR